MRNAIKEYIEYSSEGRLSVEQEITLERNKINLNEGEEKLLKLKEQLSYLLS